MAWEATLYPHVSIMPDHFDTVARVEQCQTALEIFYLHLLSNKNLRLLDLVTLFQTEKGRGGPDPYKKEFSKDKDHSHTYQLSYTATFT